MQLDVLSLDVGTSRWSGQDAQAGIKARVVPAGHDTIRLGSRHIFADHNFRSELERIDAQLWVTADRDLLGNVKVLIPEKLRQEHDPAGYASAVIPRDGSEGATLSLVLCVDETSLAHLLGQVAVADAGAITADVWIDGLKFGLPDEEIWEAADPEHSTQYLPIRHFSINVAKLRTTRRAIRDVRDRIGNEELADSDDAEERKLGMAWIRDASKHAAEESIDPSLAILRHCRALLALLLLCAALAILQRI